MQDYQEYYQTPLGLVQICAKDSGITKIAFAEYQNDAGMLGAFYHFCNSH